MTRSLLTILLLASAVSVRADHPTLSLDEGCAGPLTTVSAIGLGKGDVAVSFQSQFLFNDEISDARLERLALAGNSVHSTSSVASYGINSALGVTDEFTLGFSLPYIIRSDFRETITTTSVAFSSRQAKHGGHSHSPIGPHTSVDILSYDIEGLGDATLFGQHQLHEDEAAGLHVALLVGIKLPTGETDVRAPGGFLVGTDHQPGTGSWDPLLGFAVSRHRGPWSFDVNTLYTLSTEGARDTTVGDIFNYNAAVSYRVIGANGEAHHHDHNHDHHHHAHGPTLDVFVEANGDYREAAETAGVVDPDTGGNVIFLSGGSRLALPNGWATAFSVGTPIVTELNGIQSEPTLRLLIGVSKSF